MGAQPEQEVPPAEAPADPAARKVEHVTSARLARFGWLLWVILVVAVPVLTAATGVLQALGVSPGPWTRGLLAVLPVLGLVIALPKILDEWAPRMPVLARRVVVGLVAAVFLAVLWLLYVTRDPFGGVELPRLTGARDVAVLGFARADGSSSVELEDLSDVLAQRLQPTLGESTAHSYASDVPVDLTGLEPASPARDDLENFTSEFVQRTGSEVVLAGLVDDISGQLTMRPAIYVDLALVAERGTRRVVPRETRPHDGRSDLIARTRPTPGVLRRRRNAASHLHRRSGRLASRQGQRGRRALPRARGRR